MAMNRGLLRNPRYELYAQGVASGLSRFEAYQKAGFKGKSCSSIDRRPEVQHRIKEILDSAASRAELSRKDILDRIFEDWQLARKLGQMAAALKAGELMGKEMHRMFVERKEVGGPGDFDNKTEDELREMIAKDIHDLGWDKETSETPPDPNQIN
jgi:hypothetical protein